MALMLGKPSASTEPTKMVFPCQSCFLLFFLHLSLFVFLWVIVSRAKIAGKWNFCTIKKKEDMSLFTVSPFSGRRGEYTLYIVGNYVQSRRRLRNGVRRLFLNGKVGVGEQTLGFVCNLVEYVLLGVDVYGRREDFVQIVGSDA